MLSFFFLVGIISLGQCFVTNDWAVTFRKKVSEDVVKHVAKRSGFSYVRPIMGSPTEFHLKHDQVHHVRSKRSVHHTRRLLRHPLVISAVQQEGFARKKRGYKPAGSLPARYRYKLKQAPNDELYGKQWYIKNVGQAGGIPDLDLNVEAAWAQGITGKGVTTAIMDDGIDYMHDDLKENFNPDASFDFSSNDPYPYPRYTDDWFNSHGTRCAGEVAAQFDNKKCGVGVAHGSKIAGLRMLDQPYMTDLIEAHSMAYRPDLIDIYSASWGPTDDGRTVDGPRNLTMRAIVNGVNKGRKGLGNIYVWASGDGGPADDCNCDGYAASMWTISINSATNDGRTAGYDESCSSTLASTFSNGKPGFEDAGVATTDLYGNCTVKHSGTSAAAPEAAGVFALALEANRNLTWRDIQHLIVLTSKRNHLFDSEKRYSWLVNGAGLEFNHLFGYGVLDAGAMVELAKSWKSVPTRYHCNAGTVQGKFQFGTRMPPVRLTIDTNACAGTKSEVRYAEHVQAFISLRSTRRGDTIIYMTSPMNTTSMLLSKRPRDDDSVDGFTKWPFMTTQSWAENPRGKWVLEISSDSSKMEVGIVAEWILVLHGTRVSPVLGQNNKAYNAKLAIVKRAHELMGKEKK